MENHKKVLFFCCFNALLLIFSSALEGQNPRAKGLVFDQPKYNQSVKNYDYDIRGGKIHELPTRLSLRPFCPTPQDQGAEPSCTAWAIAYGAITIQQAILRQANKTKDVDKIACSKSFVFNQLIQAEGDIPTLEETFDFLKKSGTCLTTTFHNGIPISTKPDDLAIREARACRLLQVKEVFNPDSTIKIQRKIQRFKHYLADSTPIIIGLRLPYSFSNLSSKVFRLDPTEPIDSSAHALCLIGYDDIDSTFECLNSWGTTWGGDHGFVRLRYADLFALLCCAYQITPRFMVEKKAFNPRGGAIVLRKSIGYNNQHLPQFEEVRVQYDSLHQYYQTREDWPEGSGFQLVLREIPNDWWVYIFTINQSGDIGLFYQNQTKAGTIEKVVPSEDTHWELEEPGTEWVCILYSKVLIPDFRESLQKTIMVNPKDIPAQTADFFKEYRSNRLLYTPNRMGFSIGKGEVEKAALMLLKVVIK